MRKKTAPVRKKIFFRAIFGAYCKIYEHGAKNREENRFAKSEKKQLP